MTLLVTVDGKTFEAQSVAITSDSMKTSSETVYFGAGHKSGAIEETIKFADGSEIVIKEIENWE